MRLLLGLTLTLVRNCALLIMMAGDEGVEPSDKEIDVRWNRILDSIILLSEKLEALGFRYYDGEVYIKDTRN
jgi:hypothetical protein